MAILLIEQQPHIFGKKSQKILPPGVVENKVPPGVSE